jgi:signal transduction histidine kinase
MVVPLARGSAVFGVLALFWILSERRFGERDRGVAEDLARRMVQAIENARLYRESRELFDADLTGNFVASLNGDLLACNRTFASMLQFDGVEAAHGVNAVHLFGGETMWREFVSRIERDRQLRQRELELHGTRGTRVQVLASATGLFDDRGTLARIRGQLYDLSTHKALEAQLSQSQKIEAIGRLAGGIAHDFNNLLMVISGQVEKLQEGLTSDHPLRRSVDSVAQAADRATGLTQQLLAFSRRQVLSPQVLNLNQVVRNVYGMLERVIGEDISCALALAPEVESVKADPHRLEQALLNLAVNARDAMPGGGTLTLSTANADLDEAYGRQHVGAKPGHYVMLAVSDTGCGMDAATQARVFEPFFTTKEVGKGTGLGLAMVYGIVKQSGGYIWVYSEVGVGTTFKIYLPVVHERHEEAVASAPTGPVPRGTETILLVEDEDGVRELIEDILTAQGYRVLAASRGTEALQISEFVDGDIHLLVTDVVMPQMSGREVALRLAARRPKMRVLYLSGYTDDAISHHGIIEPGVAFLQKPFASADLARRIREVLGSPGA